MNPSLQASRQAGQNNQKGRVSNIIIIKLKRKKKIELRYCSKLLLIVINTFVVTDLYETQMMNIEKMRM